MEQNLIVGIDLGTTNSVVSVLDGRVPKTLPVDHTKLLPSAVSLTNKGFIVGQVAKNMAILEPNNTVLSVKRKMGQDVTLNIGDKKLRPEEISALILKKIKQAVAQKFGLDGKQKLRSVITVPAYFTEGQREATKQAAELAGLQVERIINEPTAAALAFGLSRMDEAIYAVYDLGGGTFDVSIIESNEGLVEVLATAGDNTLGGDDFDKLLAEFLWKKFTTNNNLPNAARSSKENARLLRIAEQTKIKLSEENEVAVQENFFYKKDGQSYHLEVTVNRADFEQLIGTKIDSTVRLLEKAINDAELEIEELDGIILVGGSSRIPLVGKRISQKLQVVPFLIDSPDEAVSHGATIQGAIINKVNIDTVLIDITPHSLGIAVLSGEGPQSIFSDEEPELHTAMIINKNTPVPVKRTQQFYAVVPFQQGYKVRVAQGEKLVFSQNKQIGEMSLELKRPVDSGSIDVTFELDINGLLKVTAQETTTKEEAKVEIKSSKGANVETSEAVEQGTIVSLDEASQNLIDRADILLKKPDLNSDDVEDLRELVVKYRAAKLANSHDAAEIESELLDLLYHLEGE